MMFYSILLISFIEKQTVTVEAERFATTIAVTYNTSSRYILLKMLPFTLPSHLLAATTNEFQLAV